MQPSGSQSVGLKSSRDWLARRRVIWPVLAGLLLVAHPVAADWPEFRGPGHQGHAGDAAVPTQWDQDGLAWKVPVAGEGWSSPSVVEGRIYLTAAVPQDDGNRPDYQLTGLCFDAANGQSLWQTSVFEQPGRGSPSIHSKNSHASPTPLVYDGNVWLHFGHMGTARLTTDGVVVWKDVPLSYRPVHGNGGSPALADGKLIYSVDGAQTRSVLALDALTGQQVWRLDREGDPGKKFAFSTPLVIDVDGRSLVISAGAGTVDALDLATGERVWMVRHGGYSVIPRPVFAHGLLFLSTGYDAPEALAIDPTGQGDVTDSHVRWRVRRGAPHTPSMLVVGYQLYMVSDRGVLSCVEAASGEVVWQDRIAGNYSASPIYAGGHLYFTSEEGRVSVVKPGPKFDLVATNELGERTLASPAVDGSALIFRTQGHLLRIE